MSADDVQLFKAVMNGEHHVRGFVNADMRQDPAEDHPEDLDREDPAQ